ncbi:MAG: hypothetical protein JSR99_02000 [Proteobacteria bacterium]|nr:hypothetical protein [Pseudomonadota bacterium]
MAASVTISGSQNEARPTLELSGEKLRLAVEALIHACDDIGGVERFAAAVRLKSEVFQERLAAGAVERLELSAFEELVPLMATVRTRVGALVEQQGWTNVRNALIDLLADANVPNTGDRRIAQFCKRFPGGKETRFVRDFAAEVLHNVYPELYPLMTRWTWDAKVNTGVLREIWYGDNVDHILIDVPDNQETFICLREELSQFLADNGIFRDMLWYVDLLCAQVYGDYINAQGGAYLRSDFSSAPDPLEQTRRILGLDRVGRTVARGKLLDAVAEPSATIKHIH